MVWKGLATVRAVHCEGRSAAMAPPLDILHLDRRVLAVDTLSILHQFDQLLFGHHTTTSASEEHCCFILGPSTEFFDSRPKRRDDRFRLLPFGPCKPFSISCSTVLAVHKS